MNSLVRLQNWYKINCDGDWEHSYGLSLTTLDNPGWYLIINLSDTALVDLQYTRSYQNEDVEDDWFHIKTDKQNLEISCGPDNLHSVLLIFLDEIIPCFASAEIIYDVYLPVAGCAYRVWFLAKGRLISEKSLELVEVPEVDYQDIMVQNLDLLDFDRDNMPDFKHSFLVGGRVETALEQMFDGVKLVAVGK